MKKIFIACDHAGLPLKAALMAELPSRFNQFSFEDLGTTSEASVDYPDFAEKVASRVAKGEGLGILVCGTGTGMAIAANKISGVRAAQAWNATSARLSREHNDSNILCLGARLIGSEVGLDAVGAWLSATYQAGRHARRVEKIQSLEKRK